MWDLVHVIIIFIDYRRWWFIDSDCGGTSSDTCSHLYHYPTGPTGPEDAKDCEVCKIFWY